MNARSFRDPEPDRPLQFRVLFSTWLQHAVTGAEIQSVEATLDARSRGWLIQQRQGRAILGLHDGFEPAEVGRARVTLRVTDPVVADVLNLGRDATGARRDRVEFFTPEIDLHSGNRVLRQLPQSVSPAELVLEVDLLDEEGEPATRHRVTAVAAAKSALGEIPLSELSRQDRTAPPGRYRSAPHRWDERFSPFCLHVDGHAIGRTGTRHMDYMARVTRHRVIVRDLPVPIRRNVS